jgi:phosphate-selective porin
MDKITAQRVIEFLRREPEAVAQALVAEHRTHQQSTIRSVVTVLIAYACSDTDLRNEASVKWAEKAVDQFEGFPFI